MAVKRAKLYISVRHDYLMDPIITLNNDCEKTANPLSITKGSVAPEAILLLVISRGHISRMFIRGVLLRS